MNNKLLLIVIIAYSPFTHPMDPNVNKIINYPKQAANQEVMKSILALISAQQEKRVSSKK